MQSDFSKQYLALNVDQKEAVEYIEGPLLVIAGPGTGKTQLLSLRAANILKKTDALSENILCLTFSESAAIEMRRRLLDIIGEEAYKITIGTYHSFGSEIIRLSPHLSSNLRPINRLKTDVIIRELQKKADLISELDDDRSVSNIAELISDAKQALLSPEDITKIADDNLKFIKQANEILRPLSEDLRRASYKALGSFRKLKIAAKSPPISNIENLSSVWNSQLVDAIKDCEHSKKAKELSRWKTRFLEKDHEDRLIAKGQWANKRLMEFASLYKAYEQWLKKGQLYDFDDMILLSINALKEHDDLRYSLQEQYQYIMLDEYQDTNLAQAELVYLLTNNPASFGKPNVMAVGDDDQAVYAFQGARHSNMLDFSKQYRSVRKITLKSNYRSTQDLIDLSAIVSEQIKDRLIKLVDGLSKNFKAARSGKGKIESLNFINESGQYVWLAEQLKLAKGEIAVISPEHKYLERASSYLAEAGLKVSYERRENILNDPLIESLFNILKLIKAIADHDQKQTNAYLATILNYDFFKLPAEDLWHLSWQAADKAQTWLDLMLKTPKLRPLALMFIKLAANTKLYRYDFIIDQILGLSDIVINDPKIKSIRSPIIASLNSEEQAKLFQQLTVIKEQFSDFNIDSSKALMAEDIIDFIRQLKASAVKLTNDFNHGPADSHIHLMTAHFAKGQEFDSVYLLSFVNEVWGQKGSHHSSLALPPNLEFIRRRALDTEDERLRLLYVALTRAKDHVTALSYQLDSLGKPATPVQFLPLKATNVNTRPDLKPLWLADQRAPKLPTDLKNELKKRLLTYALSPTDLNYFLDIRNAGPDAFYRRALLKYQTPITPRLDFGSAIHETLDWLQKSLNDHNKLPSLDELKRQYEIRLAKRRLLEHDFKKLLNEGNRSLSAYYKANKSQLTTDDQSEYNLKRENLVISGLRLTGKIDKLKIDKSSKTIYVVDYKTGKGYSSWSSQPKLHLYKHQLYFYKLLIENSKAFKGYRLTGASLDFVEPDNANLRLHKLELNFNEKEEEDFSKLLKAVWQHILKLDFPSTTSYQPNLKGMISFEKDLISGQI